MAPVRLHTAVCTVLLVCPCSVQLSEVPLSLRQLVQLAVHSAILRNSGSWLLVAVKCVQSNVPLYKAAFVAQNP